MRKSCDLSTLYIFILIDIKQTSSQRNGACQRGAARYRKLLRGCWRGPMKSKNKNVTGETDVNKASNQSEHTSASEMDTLPLLGQRSLGSLTLNH